MKSLAEGWTNKNSKLMTMLEVLKSQYNDNDDKNTQIKSKLRKIYVWQIKTQVW